MQGVRQTAKFFHFKCEGLRMIEVTRLQSQKIIVNADLIEFVEETPDTMITTTTGKKLLVKESVNEVINKVIMYRRQCLVMKLARKKR
jgi:flagellar protein FlbD